jgi:hypothetical protein
MSANQDTQSPKDPRLHVGLLTFHFVHNHGALLQAAALQHTLEEMGHRPFFINYRPTHVEKGGRLCLPFTITAMKANVKTLLQLGRWLYRSWRPHPDTYAFSSFIKKYLRIEGETYGSIQSLRLNPPVADLYLCGSDQIWNRSLQFGFDPAYFLQFGTSEVPKASYAASFGRNCFAVHDLNIIQPWLKPFARITVRELSGVKIVKEGMGMDAGHAPDPTILLKDPSHLLAAVETPDNYIFAYALRSGNPLSTTASAIARELSCKVLTTRTSKVARFFEVPKEPVGPGQWLSLIKKSRFVITNSYHGTVFSILFRKPFITVALTGSKSGYNERSRALLERLGIEDRMMGNVPELELLRCANTPIDWDSVHDQVAKLRSEGFDELRKILEIASRH